MDWITAYKNAAKYLKKYGYAVIILLLGLFLMAIPGKKSDIAEPPVTEPVVSQQDLSQALEEILCQIQGAGAVKVLLTLSSGPETVYQVNEEIPSQDGTGTHRRETVLVTDSQRAQSGLILRQLEPQYRGAVVICQGADSASVRLAIVDAVGKVTGLPSHCISVLKMK